MKFFIAFIFTFTIVGNSSAQEAPVQTIRLADGKVTCTKYSGNIYKLVYLPAGYTRNELISDAVIARPNSVRQPVEAIGAKDGKISFSFENILGQIQAFTKDGNNGFRFQLNATTKVFGGGERALPLNRRGYKFNLYNNPWYGYSEGADNLNYSVPFFTTSDGYGLFFDNPSKGYADIGKTDSNIFEVGFSSGEINVYVILGKDYKEILAGYNKLTGTQPLPPRWALGNLMSRFGYTNEAQAKDILSKMKSENIPVDAIIFDLFWFGDSIKGTMGNLDWVNKNKWPDPKKMIADFKKQDVQTILITEPFVVKSSANYNASKNFLAVDSTNQPYTIGDFYFGAGGLIDIFRKDAQDWFWSKHKPQMNNGVEAWWGDLGEPEKHPADLYHNLKDLGFKKRLFKADEVHNLYGHAWTKMLYEKYAKEYPSKRLFSLNRSGFAGTQRYGIFPWSGDVSRSWSGLRAQLPIMLGMSMSGIPYAHADAGGFAGGEGDNELYVRWLQFAAFTPIFRPHGTALYAVDTATFSFPSEAALIAEPYEKYAKKAVDMRYIMLPYNYTLAYQQASEGKPLVAPLYYYYPKDTIAAIIQDQYFWGENILVAPILTKGAKGRKVYLPTGDNWYRDIFSGSVESYKGGQWISSDSSGGFSNIPRYIKAGSFIGVEYPLHLENTADTANQIQTIVYYYDPRPSQGSLYEDDGKSKNAIKEKRYTLFNFSSTSDENKIAIKVSATGRNFRGSIKKRTLNFSILGYAIKNKQLFVDGKYVKTYDENDATVTITYSKQPVKIEIK